MPTIRFTSNHDDLSNSDGFQFKFYCDKCRNGHLTRFQPVMGGTVEGILRSAGSIFGGLFNQAANSIDKLQDTFRGTARDQAYEQAVSEAQQHFKQCTRCAKWVCPEMCWNAQAGLCNDCAPRFQEERAAAQAQGARHQLRQLAHYEVPLASPSDLHNTTPATCPHCNAPTTGSRFCPECGKPLQSSLTCPGCNIVLRTPTRFCPECGTRIPGWQS